MLSYGIGDLWYLYELPVWGEWLKLSWEVGSEEVEGFESKKGKQRRGSWDTGVGHVVLRGCDSGSWGNNGKRAGPSPHLLSWMGGGA